jgi:AmmeMemoRadiSam system protein A
MRVDQPIHAATETEHGTELVRWARARLREELGGPSAIRPEGAWCAELGATFVTLRWPDERLQGCMGTLEADRRLDEDVARNAIAAGLYDHRGEVLSLAAVDELDVELSILSPLSPIAFDDEASAHAAIRVGIDGIVLALHRRRATFLPIMWSELPDVRTFLTALKRKAGISPDLWSSDIRLWRYTVERYVDLAPARARAESVIGHE